ncbi:hypothetical protein QQP08_002951 [Theobroma cacao]|nr:hypothetical protein QQP08_002951 [Theobroma cacao]
MAPFFPQKSIEGHDTVPLIWSRGGRVWVIFGRQPSARVGTAYPSSSVPKKAELVRERIMAAGESSFKLILGSSSMALRWDMSLQSCHSLSKQQSP